LSAIDAWWIARQYITVTADEGMLVCSLLCSKRFLTLPAQFAGPAAPHRHLQDNLERAANLICRSETVIDRLLYYVTAATSGTMIFQHPALLGIAPKRKVPPVTAIIVLPLSTSWLCDNASSMVNCAPTIKQF
jgi:hypothetical protein